MSAETFCQDLAAAFPDLEAELGTAEAYHFQATMFGQYTQTAIREKNLDLAQRCFEFADPRLFLEGDRLDGTLALHWLGLLHFTGIADADRVACLERMPVRMRLEYLRLNDLLDQAEEEAT